MSNNCFVYPLIITTLSILIGLLLLTNSETLKYGEKYIKKMGFGE